MKNAGIVILVLGLLLTAFAGYNFVTREKVIEIGKLEITRKQNHLLDWSPLAGIAIMVVGGGIYFYGMKKQ